MTRVASTVLTKFYRVQFTVRNCVLLTEPGIGVKEGDYITAIDGISTATVDNIYSLLAGKANVLTELSINRTASSKGARKVVIKPLDNEYPLYHYNWVQNNIKKWKKQLMAV